MEQNNNTNEKKEEKKQIPKLRNVGANAKGLLVGTDLAEQYSVAEMYVKSGIMPKSFDSAPKIIVGMQYARELGLQPLTAMRQMCVINGAPSLWGDLPLALVRKSGRLEYIKEYRFDIDGKEISPKNQNIKSEVFGCSCIIKSKDEPTEIERWFTLDDAQKAGLINREVWKKYTATMLKYRARTEALKDGFGDILNGVSVAEYDFNDIPRDDSGVVHGTTTEIREDLDKEMTAFKQEKIALINSLCQEINSKDKTFNEAKKIQVFSEYLNTTEVTWATEKNLEALHEYLSKYFENIINKGKIDG